jgi:hypothetical protein
MADLAHAEPSIFVQATEISVQSREGEVEKYLDKIIQGVDDRELRLTPSLTNAIARKHRVIGSLSTWPPIVEVWRAARA